MERLLIIGGLFVLAGLCEIGGGYLVWGWLRESKPLFWALAGGIILALYGVVAALQPITEFGRTYAAYGGIFIALALTWGILIDGFRQMGYSGSHHCSHRCCSNGCPVSVIAWRIGRGKEDHVGREQSHGATPDEGHQYREPRHRG